jgi:N-acetylmuramoyl-L-alanine amidase
VRVFQRVRGLDESGVCDLATWGALVEASWQLGDRMLKLTSPNMRGDDVSELQASLARIGFDGGKVDGIYGPETAQAVNRFQRNCGLVADGVFGRDTLRVLERMSRQSGGGPGVTVVREQELLRSPAGHLLDCRIVVGQYGGLSSIGRAVSRQLRSAGALVVPLDEPDPYLQAKTANAFEAHLYVGLEVHDAAAAIVTYYEVPTFASVAGRALAHRLADSLTCWDVVAEATTEGRRLPILRETRMPAVLCRLGPARAVVDRSPAVAASITDAVASWISVRSL